MLKRTRKPPASPTVQRKRKRMEPTTSPTVQEKRSRTEPSSPSVIKTKYLEVVYRKIQQSKGDAVLYFVYEYFRFAQATVFARRYPSVNLEEDVDKFIQLFRDKSSARELTTNLKNINLVFDDETLTLHYLLMWLDSTHDATVPPETTFIGYMKKYAAPPPFIMSVIMNPTRVASLIAKLNIKGITGTGLDLIAKKGAFEAGLKLGIQGVGETIRSGSDISGALRKRGYDRMSVLLDMENAQNITTFVRSNRSVISSKITVANIMDPGVYMLTGIGLNDDMMQFFLGSKVMDPSVTNANVQGVVNMPSLQNQYILNNYKFNFVHNGKVFMELYSDFNPNLNPVDYNMSRAIVLKMRYAGRDVQLVTPTKKKKDATATEVFAKFFGDFFQGLIVAGTNKVRVMDGSPGWFLATGDGVLCAVYKNLCDVLQVPCKLVVDLGVAEKTVKIYGSVPLTESVVHRLGPALSNSQRSTEYHNALNGNNNNVSSSDPLNSALKNIHSNMSNKQKLTEIKSILRHAKLDQDFLEFQKYSNDTQKMVLFDMIRDLIETPSNSIYRRFDILQTIGRFIRRKRSVS